MRIQSKSYRDEWIPNYYPARIIGNDQYLRISGSGETLVLNKLENDQLDEVVMDQSLFDRLEESGLVVTNKNSSKVFKQRAEWYEKTYGGPFLHIVVITRRCNLNCTYCHMSPTRVSADKEVNDMQSDTINEVIRFALSSPRDNINFEFQGGEPFLNFEGMKYFVERAEHEASRFGKKVRFDVVTNMMVATDEQLEWCLTNNVKVSYTLGGPSDIHDLRRKTPNGRGSFRIVSSRVGDVIDKYPGLLSTSPLCVIDEDTAPYIRDLVRYYYELDFDGMAIIPLKHLGNARDNDLKLSTELFLEAYIEGLNEIVKINQTEKKPFAERSIRVALAKILWNEDVGYVDWRNPIGDVSCALTYDFDGEILPMDEARSMRDVFGLVTVVGRSYDKFMGSRDTFQTMNLSLRDRNPKCRECAYNPMCGISPVLEYARSGVLDPEPGSAFGCLFTQTVLDWTFAQYMKDPISLLRMIPGIGSHLAKIAES